MQHENFEAENASGSEHPASFDLGYLQELVESHLILSLNMTAKRSNSLHGTEEFR